MGRGARADGDRAGSSGRGLAHRLGLYGSDDELADAASEFVADGLAAGHRVVVLAEAAAAARLRSRLTAAGVDPAREERDGRLRVRPAKATLAPNGRLDAESALELVRAEADAARAAGFPALRLASLLGWALEDDRDAVGAASLEARLADAVRGLPCLALSLYDRRARASARLLDALVPHALAVLGTAPAGTGLDQALRGWLEALRRRADHALSPEARARALFDRMLNGFAWHEVVTDADGQPVDYVWLEVNDAFERQTGLRRAEVLGHRATEVLPGLREPFDWVRFFGRVALEGGEARAEQYAAPPLDRWYSVVAYQTEPRHFAAIFEEITARKRSELALQRERDLLARITETSPAGILVLGADGRATFANARAEQILGAPREALLTRTIDSPEWSVTSPDGTALPDEARPFRRVMAGEGPLFDVRLAVERPDGRRQLSVNAAPLVSAGGGAEGVVLTLDDVTDRSRLADQVLHMQKMEALGTLAGGIAHDFNNVLAGIMGHAGLLRADAPPGSPTAATAEVIERAAARGAQLARQLLGFARRRPLAAIPVDLHAALGDVLTLVSRTIDPRVRIVRRLHAPLAAVLGDPTQLQQVFLNLAVNARDAMPGGGELTLETRRIEIPGALGLPGVELKPGPWLWASVRDTGAGIPSSARSRIFEPYFTTKAGGTGLGLALSYGIVAAHGGAVAFESEPGQGTVFHVFLPALGPELPAPAAAEAATAPVKGTGSILVADDDEAIRAMLARLLVQLGYRVTCCVDGAEAVEVFARDPAAFDVALLDLTMPRMNGRDCCHELKRLRPDLPVVLSTGYGDQELVAGAATEDLAGLLSKPYDLLELSTALAAALRR